MVLLNSFIPWFLFWLFAFYKKMELTAAVIGFLAILFVILRNKRQGIATKSLQKGTAVFFILFALATLIFGKEIIIANVDLLGNSAILIIVFITIIFKRPFALEFARERARKELYFDKRLIRISYIISWFWFAVLLANFSLVAARHFSFIQIDRGLSVAIRIFNCIAAMKITQWYIRRSHILS